MANHQAEEVVVEDVAGPGGEGAVEDIMLDAQDTVGSNKGHPHHPDQGMEEVRVKQMQIVTVTGVRIQMSHTMKSLLLRTHRVRVTLSHRHHWHATKHIMRNMV